MSWSVTAKGGREEVKTAVEHQFASPLADLADEGEKATVQLVLDTILMALSTFGPEKKVSVSASGHMGYDNYEEKTGAFQSVNLVIGSMG